MRHKLPAMPFYFGDWFKATDVRICSLEARGMWIDLLGLMWESDNPGYLSTNGRPLNPTFIGRLIGASEEKVTSLLNELEANGVFSRTTEGIIYCRRIVKDMNKRELCRQAGLKGGGSPYLKTFKGSPKGRSKGEPVNETVIEDVTGSIEYKLATRLFTLIKSRNPKHKSPNLESWANDIRLMITRDGRDEKDISAVIDWCQADNFWQNNILSTSKLREQFDQLFLKMNSKPKPSTANICEG